METIKVNTYNDHLWKVSSGGPEGLTGDGFGGWLQVCLEVTLRCDTTVMTLMVTTIENPRRSSPQGVLKESLGMV